MEALAKTINELNGLSEKEAGEKCADLVRKNREMIEKKLADAETFLLAIADSTAATIAIVSTIRAMFEGASGKSHEAAMDRAVELLAHYLDERRLLASHLKLVLDIFYPLIRNAGFYCLIKKNAPEIGFNVVHSALTLMQPQPGEAFHISSAHSALFALALKCGRGEDALPFIYDSNYVICNESGKPIVNTADHVSCVWCSASSTCGIPQSMLDQIVLANATNDTAAASGQGQQSGQNNTEEPSTSSSQSGKQIGSIIQGPANVAALNAPPKHSKWIVNQANQQPSCFDCKYLLQYLYYGALIKIKTGDNVSALILLENCVLVPGNVASQIQIDAYKKFIIVSLLEYGYVPIIHGRNSAFIRSWKEKAGPYETLQQLTFTRAGRCAEHLRGILVIKEQVFNKDCNLGLLQRLVHSFEKKTVLSLAKTFETTLLSSLCQRANLANNEQLVQILQELCAEGSLRMDLDVASDRVRLEPLQSEVNEADMQKNITRLANCRTEMSRLDVACQCSPALLIKSFRHVMCINDDEGLSMAGSIDM